MELILLISDDEKIPKELREILKNDYILVDLSSIDEGIELIKKQPIHIIFLHSKVSSEKTLAYLGRLIEFDPDLVVLPVFPRADSEGIRLAIQAGAYDVLFVPFDSGSVYSVVRKAADKLELIHEINLLRSQSPDGTFEQGLPEEEGTIHSRPRTFEKPASHEVYHSQETLRRFSRAIPHIFDLGKLSEMTLSTAADIFGVSRGSLILRDREIGNYIIKASTGLSDDVVRNTVFKPAEGLPAWLLKESRILTMEYVLKNLRSEGMQRLRREMGMIGARIASPLFSKGKLIGILTLNNRMTGKRFDYEDLELLSLISNYAAVAIENALLYNEILFQKNYTENLLSNITSGVIAVNREGLLTTLNRSAERILNTQAKEVIGYGYGILDPALQEILRRTLEGNICMRHEIVLHSRNIPLGINSSILKDENGKVVGAVIIFADISEFKLLEEERRRVDRLMFWSRLSLRMAQEIKNPLVSIGTFTQLLPQKYQDDEFRRDFYEIVSKEIERLNSLIEQLLLFARPRELELKPANPNDLLAEVLTSMMNGTQPSAIQINTAYADNLPPAQIDREQIMHVFSSIITNAIQAMPTGGTLTISTKLAQCGSDGNISDYIEFDFKDTGAGIPPENLTSIFQPFFTTKIKGAGLGLAVTDRIVKDHKGEINVTSKPGVGSTFRILLPVKTAGAGLFQSSQTY
jgi:PAS domain S-box-containing protein